MFKKGILSVLSVVLVLCILFSGCNGSADGTVSYSIEVKSLGGLPLEDVKVTVYKDADLQNLQWIAETDGDGKVEFDAEASKTYYAVFSEMPDGYNVAPYYEVTDVNTTISLETVIGDAEDMTGAAYKLGSVVHDFTVTATDGKNYKLSELLKSKKAVVLNFWYLNCQPCKMEFPYLQQAYIDYQDDVALLAINPYDGTEKDVMEYATANNLTFPMAKVDSAWSDIMQLSAYPTTVVIDRYGTICFIHKGMVTSKEDITKVFEFFTADDYQQTLIRNISDIE